MLSDVQKIVFERRAEPSQKTTPESESESDSELKSGAGGFRAIQSGVKGGFIATVVMTAFRIPIARSLPPTADFWAKYVGTGGPDEYTVQGILLHLLYGAGSGAVFASFCFPRKTGSEAKKERQGILWGAVFGLLLSVFGVQVVLKRLLDMDLEPDERLIFHVSHAIYGLTLGAWIGSNT